MSRVVAIFGPTASGKTDVAEAIADRIPAELVSADAMQAYRGLPILTNQSERPTALVGVWPLSHDGSLAEYQELAHRAVDESLAHGQDARRRRRDRPLPSRRGFRPRAAAAAGSGGA